MEATAPVFVCEECDYSTTRKEHLKYHKKNVHPVVKLALKCDRCDYCTYTAEYLRKHVKRKHTDERRPQFKCPYEGCLFTSAYKANVQNHERRIHGQGNAVSPLTCEVCGFSTLYAYSLANHSQVMHGIVRPGRAVPYQKSYSCEQCSFSAKRYYLLKNHIEEKHATPTPSTNQ